VTTVTSVTPAIPEDSELGTVFLACKQCGSDEVREFRAEINLNPARFCDSDQQPILVFPNAYVCTRCGKGEFFLLAPEIKVLSQAISKLATK
jgi:hypothetical protein